MPFATYRVIRSRTFMVAPEVYRRWERSLSRLAYVWVSPQRHSKFVFPSLSVHDTYFLTYMCITCSACQAYRYDVSARREGGSSRSFGSGEVGEIRGGEVVVAQVRRRLGRVVRRSTEAL